MTEETSSTWPVFEPDCDGDHPLHTPCRPPVEGCFFRGSFACRHPHDCIKECP